MHGLDFLQILDFMLPDYIGTEKAQQEGRTVRQFLRVGFLQIYGYQNMSSALTDMDCIFLVSCTHSVDTLAEAQQLYTNILIQMETHMKQK